MLGLGCESFDLERRDTISVKNCSIRYCPRFHHRAVHVFAIICLEPITSANIYISLLSSVKTVDRSYNMYKSSNSVDPVCAEDVIRNFIGDYQEQATYMGGRFVVVIHTQHDCTLFFARVLVPIRLGTVI